MTGSTTRFSGFRGSAADCRLRSQNSSEPLRYASILTRRPRLIGLECAGGWFLLPEIRLVNVFRDKIGPCFIDGENGTVPKAQPNLLFGGLVAQHPQIRFDFLRL